MMTWQMEPRVNSPAELGAKAELLGCIVRLCRCATHRLPARQISTCQCVLHRNVTVHARSAAQEHAAAPHKQLHKAQFLMLAVQAMICLCASPRHSTHNYFMQEAFDIFGDVGELLAMYDARKTTDADDLEAEQEPDFSDEEAAETFRIEQVCDRV